MGQKFRRAQLGSSCDFRQGLELEQLSGRLPFHEVLELLPISAGGWPGIPHSGGLESPALEVVQYHLCCDPLSMI